MEWYWIVLIVVGSASALVGIYALLCYVISQGVLKAATTPVAHTIEEARDYQVENENIDINEYDNIWQKQAFEVDGSHGKIRGDVVFNPQKSTPQKVAVVCHGHTWNRINSIKYAKIFYDKGYNVVMFDHAYFGLSDGDFTTLGCYEQHDLSAVIDHARQVFGSDAFMVLHGESMGAATVLLELGLRNDINCVVADCPFSNTMKYYRELCVQVTHLPGFPIVDMANATSKRKFGYDFSKVNPIDAVAGSQTPICFIHGAADTFIRPAHSEAMFESSQSPLSELHLVDGAGHARSYLTDNQKYREIVWDFLDKVESAQQNK